MRVEVTSRDTAVRVPVRRIELPAEIFSALALDRERRNGLRALAYLAGGLLSLVVLLAFSLVLLPEGIAHQVGLSYYGARPETIVPYALAFLSAAFATQRAAGLLPARRPALRRLRGALRAIVLLLLAVLVTPYTGGAVLDWLHLAFTGALFATATALSLWLAVHVLNDWPIRMLAAVQVAAALLMLLSQSDSVHFLAAGELLFLLAFGLLLLRALAQLLPFTLAGSTSLKLTGSEVGRQR